MLQLKTETKKSPFSDKINGLLDWHTNIGKDQLI